MPQRPPPPAQPPPTSPEDVDPRVARTHQAVREAVRRLVQRAGFEAVSHQQVAVEAGIGRATVYRHWPQRTDLLLHALAEVETPHAWHSSGDLATDLGRELERLQRTMSSPLVPELIALIGRAEWNPELRKTQTELLATGTAGLRRTLEAAIDRGELPADHDLDTTIARLAGPLFYRRVLARAPLEDEFVTTIITAYLNEVATTG